MRQASAPVVLGGTGTVAQHSLFQAIHQGTDLVPVELTLVAIPRGATIRNGVVTWPLGNLAPRASRTLSMRVRVNPQFTGTITNTATVTAVGMRPRRDTARTRVVGPEPVVQTGGVTG